MKSSKNKELLYMLMTDYFTTKEDELEGTTTLVMTNGDNTLAENMPPSTHLEADWRMVGHILDGIRAGHSSCRVRCNDTDVVFILLAYMPQFLGLNDQFQLKLDFGTSTGMCDIDLNSLYHGVGPSRCRGMLFLHAFTGNCNYKPSTHHYHYTKLHSTK